ncbi:MAG: hypothetical protein U0441_30685 [Polyangiaceae bacterium]
MGIDRLPRGIALTVACVLLTPLLALGCGKKGPPPPERSSVSEVMPTPVEEALTDDSFRAVCDGKGEARAKGYAKDAAAAHAMVAFQRDEPKGDLRTASVMKLERFRPQKLEDVEVVVCITRTPGEKTETCTFDDKQPPYFLELHNASYEVSVREAKTGNVLVTKTVNTENHGCPMLHTFSAQTESDFPTADHVVTGIAAPFLLPATVTADTKFPNGKDATGALTTYDLPPICYGLPEPRAAAYEKKPGQTSFAAMLHRASESENFMALTSFDLEAWKAPTDEQYQLVICSTEKSRKKKESCKFDDPPPVHVLDVYSATYESVLREARTGKILATKTVNIPAMSCPMSWSFRGTHEDHIPRPDGELKAPFGSFVGGK